jgi:hypothetical protein
LKQGGTEMTPMSTSREKTVALNVAASVTPLVFHFKVCGRRQCPTAPVPLQVPQLLACSLGPHYEGLSIGWSFRNSFAASCRDTNRLPHKRLSLFILQLGISLLPRSPFPHWCSTLLSSFAPLVPAHTRACLTNRFHQTFTRQPRFFSCGPGPGFCKGCLHRVLVALPRGDLVSLPASHLPLTRFA